MRMLQVDELRRAMGFGEDYALDHGSRRDKIKMLGNGVCPPVMQSIVSKLTNQNSLDYLPRMAKIDESRMREVQMVASSATALPFGARGH